MRNLKRALSLVLAVVMVIGLMVVGASAVSYNDFSDRGEIVNKDAVSMLTTLGIIEGQPDGSYNPAGNVDRAQMAKMISVALTNNEDCDTLYQNVNSGLTDISANWARGYINYCYVRGIIAGRGDNTFDPSANVTGVEAAKMLLAALGYNAEIEGLVGPDWALNTAALAQQLGIFRNFTKDVNAPLNRDDAALLIYNALDVEMIQQYQNGYALVYGDHRTILSSVFGVIRVEGVVAGNEWAQLQRTDSDAAMREGKTVLENVIWYDSTTANTRVEEGKEVTGYVTFNVSTPEEYIGKAVTMYVEKTTILSNSVVVGVATNDDMNVVVSTDSSDSDADDLLDGTGVSVDENTEYYVNYGYYRTAAAAAERINNYKSGVTGRDFNLNGIRTEVIDNDDDGLAEYVLYKQETLSQVVRYSERNETVSLYELDRGANDRLDGNTSSFTEDLDDVVMDETMTLAAEDLVLYIQYGGRTYITAPEIVTGTMTQVDRDRDDELFITIDDADTYYQSYILDAASPNDPDIENFDIDEARDEVGFETLYDFILDTAGYIVAFRPAEETAPAYALVLGSAWTQNALTYSGEIKVLTADNTEDTYDINWDASAKNAFWNGVGKYDSAAKTAANTALQNYLGTIDVRGGKGTNAAAGTVIEYSLNEDGVLTIKNILNLNDLAADSSIAVADDDSKAIAYIAENSSASAYGRSDDNLQYKLEDAYENGDGYITVDVNGTHEEFTYAIDLNTIAFYYVNSSTYGVATGWENMSDVDARTPVQIYPVSEKRGDNYVLTSLAEVVLFKAEPTANTEDWLLVLTANAVNSKTIRLNVVFEDGTTAAINVDRDTYESEFDQNGSYMVAYTYSENSDGTYDLDTGSRTGATTAKLLQNGTLSVTRNSDYPWANSKYPTIVTASQIWDVTEVDNADDEVTPGKFSYDLLKNAVIITNNEDRVLQTAWVWDRDVSSGDGVVALGDARVELDTDHDMYLVYNPGNKLTRTEIGDAVLADLRSKGATDLEYAQHDEASRILGVVTGKTSGGTRFNYTVGNAYLVSYNGDELGLYPRNWLTYDKSTDSVFNGSAGTVDLTRLESSDLQANIADLMRTTLTATGVAVPELSALTTTYETAGACIYSISVGDEAAAGTWNIMLTDGYEAKAILDANMVNDVFSDEACTVSADGNHYAKGTTLYVKSNDPAYVLDVKPADAVDLGNGVWSFAINGNMTGGEFTVKTYTVAVQTDMHLGIYSDMGCSTPASGTLPAGTTLYVKANGDVGFKLLSDDTVDALDPVENVDGVYSFVLAENVAAGAFETQVTYYVAVQTDPDIKVYEDKACTVEVTYWSGGDGFAANTTLYLKLSGTDTGINSASGITLTPVETGVWSFEINQDIGTSQFTGTP